MATGASFSAFEQYKLSGVEISSKNELGHGSYATVQELEYMGLKCAGKKIHDILLQQGDASYTLRRFEEECRLLSQARHPNIVQFLGVHFQCEVRVPILVMEYLPTNLTSCIEQYGILSKEIGYSILHDVALGLCYLHSQIPPIIHRDLSSNNVLLTANMTAKISDLGMARIFNNLTPLQVSRLTNAPGTPAFMPPEAIVTDSEYNTSIDIFSYGILMIHMFSGRWPEPQVGPNRMEEGRLIPVTEAERRKVFLRVIGNEHPLMGTIQQCVHNDAEQRPSARKILERTAAIRAGLSPPFSNTLEMLNTIEKKEREISTMVNEAKQRDEKSSRQRITSTHEIKNLKLHVRDLHTQIEHITADNDANVKKLQVEEKQRVDELLSKERNQIRLLTEEKRDLQSQILQSNNERDLLQHEVTNLKQDIAACVHDKDAEIAQKGAMIDLIHENLALKTRTLKEKDAIISEMQERLDKAKEYLLDKEQVRNINRDKCNVMGFHQQTVLTVQPENLVGIMDCLESA